MDRFHVVCLLCAPELRPGLSVPLEISPCGQQIYGGALSGWAGRFTVPFAACLVCDMWRGI